MDRDGVCAYWTGRDMGTQLNSLKISQLKALALGFNSEVK